MVPLAFQQEAIASVLLEAVPAHAPGSEMVYAAIYAALREPDGPASAGPAYSTAGQPAVERYWDKPLSLPSCVRPLS